jgi:hypothetical protein
MARQFGNRVYIDNTRGKIAINIARAIPTFGSNHGQPQKAKESPTHGETLSSKGRKMLPVAVTVPARMPTAAIVIAVSVAPTAVIAVEAIPPAIIIVMFMFFVSMTPAARDVCQLLVCELYLDLWLNTCIHAKRSFPK